MKCDSSVTENSSMSVKGCSIKLRILILVINTANLINERATPTLGISHGLVTPTALFTTYIFIGIFVTFGIYKHYASWFLQVYALGACFTFQLSLSFVVFKELRSSQVSKYHAALVLDGVLPMINGLLLLSDLIGIIFSKRQERSIPSMPSSLPTDLRSRQSSPMTTSN